MPPWGEGGRLGEIGLLVTAVTIATRAGVVVICIAGKSLQVLDEFINSFVAIGVGACDHQFFRIGVGFR